MRVPDFLPDDISRPETQVEIPEEVRISLVEAVTTAVSEHKAAETTDDLIRKSWLMDRILNHALDSVEAQGISLEGLDAAVPTLIARTLSKLLPAEPPGEAENGGIDERDTGDGDNDREPRRPRPVAGSGAVALEVTVELQTVEAHGGRRTDAPLDLP